MKSAYIQVNTGGKPHLVNSAKQSLAFNAGKPIQPKADLEREKWKSNLQSDIDLELKRQQESIERLSLELLKQVGGKV